MRILPLQDILKALIITACIAAFSYCRSQPITNVTFEGNKVESISTENKILPVGKPLLYLEIDDKPSDIDEGKVQATIEPMGSNGGAWQGKVRLTNATKDTLSISNVLPLGRDDDHVFITGLGNHRLSRTHLFRPHFSPVNIIVPDNAWELGYHALPVNDSLFMYALARRDVNSINNGIRKRFETILAPGGSVSYHFYFELYQGDWQEGIRLAFNEQKLFDLEYFDDTIYKRIDLQWIRKSYVMHLIMAWDKSFYNPVSRRYTLLDFLRKGKMQYGGDDAVCIWPTWPTLGIDQRNQFDMYKDLPGGLTGLKALADSLRMLGTRFFVAYNPWDESTRREDHLKGLADLIAATSADGVVLDTKGESSKELQEAADAVKPGVIMYSEGMAVPRHMTGIVAGRVHNALYHPPLLNLNKLIQPNFAIFRVSEVYKEPIFREFAVAFFNGYGTEINQFAPGHPHWEDEQNEILGRTTRILRENTSCFTKGTLTPLLNALVDSIYVNEWQWQYEGKTLYTILNLRSRGHHAPLFTVKQRTPGSHAVDLWNHEEVMMQGVDNHWNVMANLDAFNPRWRDTNNEGSVGCIAIFQRSLKVTQTSTHIIGTCKEKSVIRIWKGNPSYSATPIELDDVNCQFNFSINTVLGPYEGKLVVQEFNNEQLTDEVILFLTPGEPRLTSSSTFTKAASRVGMVKIPAGDFTWAVSNGDEFIPYPKPSTQKLTMRSFYMDQFPVTNEQFYEFIKATRYQPQDTVRFLAHWGKGEPKPAERKFPVVNVSYADALAYAQWAGKRLPTEVEWQYAAQTSKGNEWPWNQRKPVTRKKQYVTETLTVSAIEGIDPGFCNLGDGQLYHVGKFKRGVNPHGLFDLTGCVWQLTNDVYETGSYRYIIMKGGSYFKPSSNWWYVQGGPRELHYRQQLLRVSDGFERNATVGFRCVSDE